MLMGVGRLLAYYSPVFEGVGVSPTTSSTPAAAAARLTCMHVVCIAVLLVVIIILHLSAYLSAYLPIYRICLPIYLPIYLSIFLAYGLRATGYWLWLTYDRQGWCV